MFFFVDCGSEMSHTVHGTLFSQVVQLLYKSFHLMSTFSEQTTHENGLFIKFRVE
jgi:hypothetical protein